MSDHSTPADAPQQEGLLARRCLRCGAEFFVTARHARHHAARYCSRSCYESRSTPLQRSCLGCGKEFLLPRHRARQQRGVYCSPACVHPSRPASDRFREKVKRTDGCWLWTGCRNRQGYGLFRPLQGKTVRNVLAHRFAWEEERGPIPPGLCVLHHCDNPCCVRVGHLFLGTRSDNAADKVRKGRAGAPRGTAHPRCKLQPDQVRTIRARHAAGTSASQLARDFSISLRNVRSIINRRIWRHL